MAKEVAGNARFEVIPNRLIDSVKGDGSPQGYVSIGKELDLLAILRGKVGKDQAGLILAVTAVSASDGRSLGMMVFRGETFAEVRARIREDLWTELEPMLERAQSAPATSAALLSPADTSSDESALSSADEQEPEEPEASSPKAPAREPDEPKPEPAPVSAEPAPAELPGRAPKACPAVTFASTLGLTRRWFNFSRERAGGDLIGHRLDSSPFVATELGYFPAAHASCGAVAGLGLRGGYERVLANDSEIDGTSLGLTAFGHHAEAVFALPIDRFSVTPKVGYAYRHVELEGERVPDARFVMLALGLEAGARFGLLLAELDAAARLVLDAGELAGEGWFPHARGKGFSTGAKLGVGPLGWLDLFVEFQNELYTFDLRPELGGPFPRGIASSSYDQSFYTGFGLRFMVPERAVP